jgi:phosphoribosylformylglycinamidine synthase PurS subunit
MEPVMIVRVIVTLKPNVLDPQGMTIQRALVGQGFAAARNVRQGKYFEIEWDGQVDDPSSRQQLEAIASQVLSNPVIEGYRIEWPGVSRA